MSSMLLCVQWILDKWALANVTINTTHTFYSRSHSILSIHALMHHAVAPWQLQVFPTTHLCLHSMTLCPQSRYNLSMHIYWHNIIISCFACVHCMCSDLTCGCVIAHTKQACAAVEPLVRRFSTVPSREYPLARYELS